MAWKTQLRLTQWFAALPGRGVQVNKACVAEAREPAGFIWAIGMQAQREGTRPHELIGAGFIGRCDASNDGQPS